MSSWDKWHERLHTRPDQVEKIKRAKSTLLTPVSLDREQQLAEFSGKHGRYKTNLISCTCGSFGLDGNAPCKHMYRLAMELGLFDSDFETSKYDIVKPDKEKVSLDDAVAVYENLSEDSKRTLYFVLYRIIGAHDPYAFIPDIKEYEPLSSAGILEMYHGEDAKVEALKTLRPKSVLVHALNSAGFTDATESMKVAELREMFLSSGLLISEICPDKLPVTTTSDYSAARRKLYTYILRAEGYGYAESTPADVIRLLEKFGHI